MEKEKIIHLNIKLNKITSLSVFFFNEELLIATCMYKHQINAGRCTCVTIQISFPGIRDLIIHICLVSVDPPQVIYKITSGFRNPMQS